MVLSGKFSIPAIEPKESHFFKIPCAISADPVFEVRITTPRDEEKRLEGKKRASPPGNLTQPMSKVRVHMSETSDAIEIKGQGSGKSDFFSMKEGTYVFRCTLDTDAPFSLRLLDNSGWEIDQITNEWEGFAGSKEIEIETEGRYLVDVIAADRVNWLISAELSPGPEKTEEPEKRPVRVKVWVDDEGVTHATDSP
ncbi:MAG: hypothetical protein JRK53_05210 [Deltaproteobacteria bacterium]|nr:hypothetical protein [Deltaproteobacteria bacterium]MBW2284344.1 hypothetical protein [Deltaproteobacteria bacterium]